MDKIAVFAPNIHYTRQKQATMNAIPRESYLNRIEHYPGKDTIIILTGQRRIGKSYLLRLFRDKVSRGRSMPMSFSSTRRSTVFWESRMSCRPLSRLCQFIFLRHPLWESRKIRLHHARTCIAHRLTHLLFLVCISLYLTTFFVITRNVESGGVELILDGFGGSE